MKIVIVSAALIVAVATFLYYGSTKDDAMSKNTYPILLSIAFGVILSVVLVYADKLAEERKAEAAVKADKAEETYSPKVNGAK